MGQPLKQSDFSVPAVPGPQDGKAAPSQFRRVPKPKRPKKKKPRRRRATPDPVRVAAGRKNVEKRQGFTPEGLKRVRETCQTNQPWLQSTGPVTDAGRRQSAANGKKSQIDRISHPEFRVQFAAVVAWVQHLEGKKPLGPGPTGANQQCGPGGGDSDFLDPLGVAMPSANGFGSAGGVHPSVAFTAERKHNHRRQSPSQERASRRIPKPLPTSVLAEPYPGICCLRPNASAPPPARVWHLSSVIGQFPRRAKAKLGIASIRDVRRFRSRLDACETLSDLRKVKKDWPTMFAAFEIAGEPIDSSRRETIEMLVLAGLPASQIGPLVQLDQAVIAAYERLFFNVRSALKSPDYITSQVIRLRGCDASSCSSRLKRQIAHFGGPKIAHTLIDLFCPAATGRASLANWSELEILQTKAGWSVLMALELLPAEDPRVGKLLRRLHDALEKQAVDSGMRVTKSEAEYLQRGVRVMLEHSPYLREQFRKKPPAS